MVNIRKACGNRVYAFSSFFPFFHASSCFAHFPLFCSTIYRRALPRGLAFPLSSDVHACYYTPRVRLLDIVYFFFFISYSGEKPRGRCER